MDIKYFALSKWVECDLMLLECIDTSINISDHFTKSLQMTLFHWHADFLLGHIPPAYSPVYRTIIANMQQTMNVESVIPRSFTTPIMAAAARVRLITLDTHGYPWWSMGFTIHLFPSLVVYFTVDCEG
jgi:hypothetical protein